MKAEPPRQILHVDELAAQREAIARGRAAVRDGRVVDHDVVAGWLDSWFTPNEKPQPECERKPPTK